MKCANSRLIRVLPLFLGLFVLTDLWGQTSSGSLTCKPEILVGVTAPDGQLIRGLSASSFTATQKKRTIPIEAADYDRSGRRIVLVIDRGSHMNKAAQALARAVVNRVLSNARPQDSFGLIIAGPGPMRIALGTSASDLLGRLAASDSRQDSAEKSGSWMQSPNRPTGFKPHNAETHCMFSRAMMILKTVKRNTVKPFKSCNTVGFGFSQCSLATSIWEPITSLVLSRLVVNSIQLVPCTTLRMMKRI